MKAGRDMAIFKSINDDKWTDKEKAEAIYQVLHMATINSVTKQDLVDVALWLWNQQFEWLGDKYE